MRTDGFAGSESQREGRFASFRMTVGGEAADLGVDAVRSQSRPTSGVKPLPDEEQG